MIPGIVAQGVQAAGGGGGDPMDDDFSGGALDAKWLWRQQGGAGVTLAGGIGTFATDGASSDPTVQQIYQALPAVVGIWTARVAGHATVNFQICGLHIRNNTGGQIYIFGFHKNSVGSGRRIVVIRFGSETSYSSNAYEADDPNPDGFHVLQIELTATHIIFRAGATEGSLSLIFTEAIASFLTSPDQIGFGLCDFTGGAFTMELDYFHRDA